MAQKARFILPTPVAPRVLHGPPRGGMELGPGGEWITAGELVQAATPEILAAVTFAIRLDIKDALWGLALWFGRDAILKLCAEIIDEDLTGEHEQTPTGFDADDLRDPEADAGGKH